MFTIRMAEISETAGNSSDGVVRGMIGQSSFVGLNNNFEWQETLIAIRRYAVNGGYIFSDISAEAVSGTPDACMIWGDDTTFSSADSVYISSDDVVISELRVTITTPGVWDGAGIAIYDSPDGISARRQLTIIRDDTNGFRNGPGTYAITWETPPTPSMEFSPVPDGVPMHRWIVVKPVGMTSATTAPKISMIYALHGTENAPFVDFTDLFNSSMDDGNFGSYPDVLVFMNSVDIFTFAELPVGMDFMVYRAVSENACSGIIEYLASDNTWKALPNVIDGTNSFQNGPATLDDPPQLLKVRWGIPNDWSAKTLVLPLLGGGATTVAGYQARYRVTEVNAAAPVHPSLAKGRARMLGDGSGGIYHYQTANYMGVTFEAGVPATEDVVVQIININNGNSGIFTIPAGEYSSANVSGQRLDLSNSIHVSAGDSLIVAWLSGGTVKDVELVLQ
jgi:hypothetical protein